MATKASNCDCHALGWKIKEKVIMPYYEYECNFCKNKFEEYKAMEKCKEDTRCPDCGKDAKRVMSRLNWKPFVGSLKYDRQNGFFPGTTASDYKNKGTEDW